MKIDHAVALSILKKIGAEFTDKIPIERAIEKIKRIVGKKGLPEDADWDKAETKALTKLELIGEDANEAEDEKPAKKGKKDKGKKKKAPKAKAEGNIDKMKRLIAEGKSEKEILKIFTTDYAAEDKTDKEWIRKRVGIYHNLATGKAGKKKDKTAKKDKTEKSEKKSGKVKKKSKKAKSDDADE